MKDRFIKCVRENVHRDGIENLLINMERSDFYTAPASTRYHDAEEGGLLKHSLKVFSTLSSDLEGTEYNKDTIATVSLFHDICKIGCYKQEMRNTKDEHGKWIQVPYYTKDDKFPMGHGEKSVIMLMDAGIRLTPDEMMAIRFHMGGFESKEIQPTLSRAWSMCPLAVALHIADLKATYGL